MTTITQLLKLNSNVLHATNPANIIFFIFGLTGCIVGWLVGELWREWREMANWYAGAWVGGC